MLKAPRTRGLRWLRETDLAALTRTEVAELFEVDTRTVTRAIEAGDLPSIQLGRRVLIPRLPLLAKLGVQLDPTVSSDGDAA